MKKNKLKIGDVARELGIKKSIIRQWEQEFGLKTNQHNEQTHYYSSDEMHILSTIRDLIKVQGLSIDDAKARFNTVPAAECEATATMNSPAPQVEAQMPQQTVETLTESLPENTPSIIAAHVIYEEQTPGNSEEIILEAAMKRNEMSCEVHVSSVPYIQQTGSTSNTYTHTVEEPLAAAAQEPSTLTASPVEELQAPTHEHSQAHDEAETFKKQLARFREQLVLFKRLLSN